MKSKIIIIVSGLSVLGLGVFAVVQMNSTNSYISIIAVALSLIPMYFLYAAVVLGKYRDKESKIVDKDSRLEEMMQERRKYKEFYASKKAANDYGKVLEFPKDKNKKNDKQK